MVETEDPPTGAMTLEDAVERFGSSEPLAAWRKASGRGYGVDAFSRAFLDRDSLVDEDAWENARKQQAASRECQDAAERLSADIVERFVNGELVAWGRPDHPATSYVKLPSDAWNYLSPDWLKNTAVTDVEVSYFSVRVFPAVFVDSRWDGGLPLMEAARLLDSYLADDLVAPWSPKLPNSTPDQNWADGSTSWAADQLWRIICRYQTVKAVSLYVRNPDDSNWFNIHEITADLKDSDSDRLDFIESRIRLDCWDEPVSCVLVRFDEEPKDAPQKSGENVGAQKENAPPEIREKPRFSKDKVELAYRERFENWPDDELPPSRVDDEIWGRKECGASREIVREFRNSIAPKSWISAGRRKKSHNSGG